jgi:integrase
VPDIDWSEGVLTIRDAKFRKSRLVPLHVSSLKVLSDYAVRRNHLFASRNSGYFFPSRRGARLDEGQVRRTFYRLSRQINLFVTSRPIPLEAPVTIATLDVPEYASGVALLDEWNVEDIIIAP